MIDHGIQGQDVLYKSVMKKKAKSIAPFSLYYFQFTKRTMMNDS